MSQPIEQYVKWGVLAAWGAFAINLVPIMASRHPKISKPLRKKKKRNSLPSKNFPCISMDMLQIGAWYLLGRLVESVRYIASQSSVYASATASASISNIQTTECFYTTVRSKRKGRRYRVKCAFCSDSHFSDTCKKYDTVSARRKRASELKCCMRCLLSNHETGKCTADVHCFHCKLMVFTCLFTLHFA